MHANRRVSYGNVSNRDKFINYEQLSMRTSSLMSAMEEVILKADYIDFD